MHTLKLLHGPLHFNLHKKISKLLSITCPKFKLKFPPNNIFYDPIALSPIAEHSRAEHRFLFDQSVETTPNKTHTKTYVTHTIHNLHTYVVHRYTHRSCPGTD